MFWSGLMYMIWNNIAKPSQTNSKFQTICCMHANCSTCSTENCRLRSAVSEDILKWWTWINIYVLNDFSMFNTWVLNWTKDRLSNDVKFIQNCGSQATPSLKFVSLTSWCFNPHVAYEVDQYVAFHHVSRWTAGKRRGGRNTLARLRGQWVSMSLTP
jgi:hypothetical protein